MGDYEKLLEDYEAMKAHNLSLVEEVTRLKLRDKKMHDAYIKWQVWKQFYSRIMSVRSDAPDAERVLKQAEIISDMQRRIRGQRSEIRRLIQSDKLAPNGAFPRHNVYRHCNKLYKMWWELKEREIEREKASAS